MVRQRELVVIQVMIQSAKDNPNGGVEGGARRYVDVILRLHRALIRWVGAANVRDVVGRELGLDAGLADDEDGGFGGFGLEDQGDVGRGAVGGAEDFGLGGGDAHGRELLLVVGAGFGAVVGYEDDLFACGFGEH